MKIKRIVPSFAARAVFLLLTGGAWAGCDPAPTDSSSASSSSASFSSAANAVDPALLTPNPVEASVEGTVWECRETGPGVQCDGHWHLSVPISPNGLDCGGQIMYAPSEQNRDQVRYFNADLLEYRRERHQSGSETWGLTPDGSGPTVTYTWSFLERVTFAEPGNLDSGLATERGSNFKVRATDGRVLLQNAGHDSGLLSGDPDTFKGRWDGGALEAVCAVLTGE